MMLNNELVEFIKAKGYEDECLLYLLAIRHGLKCKISEEGFQFLVRENLVKLNLLTNQIVLQIGLYEGEEVNISEIDLSVEQEIRSRVDEYRKLFKGIRTNSIGDKQKVISLLIQFCINNSVSFDTVLDVTKHYIDNTEYKLNADNFISRIDKSGEELSALKTAVEEYSMSSNDAGLWKVI